MNLEQYSARIALYVSVFADLLLQRLAAGEALMEVAEKTAYTASDMTGGDFSLTMFGHAVGFMRGSWIHGKQLGEWYDASVFCLPAGVEVPILLKDWPKEASKPAVKAAIAKAAAQYRQCLQ